MKKNKQYSNICFLEVSPEDYSVVKKTFPGAKIFKSALPAPEIIKQAAEIEVLCIFTHSKVSAEVLKYFPKLKLIVTRSVGYDHVNLRAVKERGIIVCNVPDYGSHVISEFVFALLLSGLRHIGAGDTRVETAKAFSFQGLRGIALKGKTLGIIGTGKIGINVARIASLGFLMKVLAYDPHPNPDLAEANHFKYVRLNTLLKNSDIISLHCPLLESTKYLINRQSIALMKSGVIIVNTSRGALINSEDLTKAVIQKKIAYAFLDVLEHEDNLKVDRELIKLDNVIVTPHIAFYADDSLDKMYQLSFKTIKAYLRKQAIPGEVAGY